MRLGTSFMVIQMWVLLVLTSLKILSQKKLCSKCTTLCCAQSMRIKSIRLGQPSLEIIKGVLLYGIVTCHTLLNLECWLTFSLFSRHLTSQYHLDRAQCGQKSIRSPLQSQHHLPCDPEAISIAWPSLKEDLMAIQQTPIHAWCRATSTVPLLLVLELWFSHNHVRGVQGSAWSTFCGLRLYGKRAIENGSHRPIRLIFQRRAMHNLCM